MITCVWAQTMDTVYVTIRQSTTEDMTVEVDMSGIHVPTGGVSMTWAYPINITTIRRIREEDQRKWNVVVKKAQLGWWEVLARIVTGNVKVSPDWSRWMSEEEALEKHKLLAGYKFMDANAGGKEVGRVQPKV